MKVFISQPMGGLSEQEIDAKRQVLSDKIRLKHGNDVEILDTNFHFPGQNALYYLAKSLEKLASADIAYFANGWEDYKGCMVEMLCCHFYGVKIASEIDLE